MILETQEQARAALHEPGLQFRCSDCGEVKPVQTSGGTGYGYDEQDRIVCYACCGKRDRARMIETGRATLYFTSPYISMLRPHSYGGAQVSNWPGTLEFNGRFKKGRHNIALYRYDVWFWGPDGFLWHGVTYGDNTQICHCKRTKQKKA